MVASVAPPRSGRGAVAVTTAAVMMVLPVVVTGTVMMTMAVMMTL
jgi:Flp pilus assembly protein TadG